MKDFVDATVFMGMHSKNEEERIACKNFFVKRISKPVWMSLEQVGRCDDIIWRKFSRRVQDLYYPFMDKLHTIMAIKRVPFDKKTIDLLSSVDDELSQGEKLTVAMASAHGGRLYTLNTHLLELNKDSIVKPHSGDELKFPEGLEDAYQESLVLRT